MNRPFISPALELFNNYLAVHPVHVMKGAVVIVMPFVGKEDADSRRPGSHLRRTGSIRFCCLNESRIQEAKRSKGRRRWRDRILLRREGGITRSRPGSRRRGCSAIDCCDNHAGSRIRGNRWSWPKCRGGRIGHGRAGLGNNHGRERVKRGNKSSGLNPKGDRMRLGRIQIRP